MSLLPPIIKEEALHVMVRNQTEEKKKISILGIQMKEIGDPRRMAFHDLTTLTGANILGRNITRTRPTQKRKIWARRCGCR